MNAVDIEAMRRFHERVMAEQARRHPVTGCTAIGPCVVVDRVKCTELMYRCSPQAAAERPCRCLCHFKAEREGKV